LTYIKNALFIYDDEKSDYLFLVEDNEFGTLCKKVRLETFLQNPQNYTLYAEHILSSCSNENLHTLLQVAVEYEYSLAFLPSSKQKSLIRTYALSSKPKENLELALRAESKPVDLIFCDGEFWHIKVHLGDTPLIQSVNTNNSLLTNLFKGIKQFFKLRLFAYDIVTASEKEIKTAASGLLIVNHVQEKGLLKSLFADSSMREGKLSMIIVSPFSIIEYVFFLFSILRFSSSSKKLPTGISFVKSEKLSISTSNIPVSLDDIKEIRTPIECEIQKEKLCINAGDAFWENNPKVITDKEVMKTSTLPDEKERAKYLKSHLPFFGVASKERFRELFQILRDDAKTNTHFIVLMFLSTMLAAIGLFANSAAVVIGAMVLAPLMTPIVAFSMGLLRGENEMLRNALIKIFWGIVVALSASSFMALLLPQMELTGELKARINPTLLDLGVAIFSGVAAAYSKSHKSLRESLAGVAIAVALVPPLATAGIGLGRGEFYVFYGAFLLFFTNLVGISLAATISFQFLGFSNAVKSKKSLLAVSMVLAIVSYPLYLSYTEILDKYQLNTLLVQNRYLVDDKYIIIKRANILHKEDVDVIRLKILVRESLNRKELEMLKKKIQQRAKRKIYLQIETEYIL